MSKPFRLKPFKQRGIHMNKVSFDVFCHVWQTSARAQDVAELLGMSIIAVYRRVNKYRSLFGVDLKQMPRGPRPRTPEEKARIEAQKKVDQVQKLLDVAPVQKKRRKK